MNLLIAELLVVACFLGLVLVWTQELTRTGRKKDGEK